MPRRRCPKPRWYARLIEAQRSWPSVVLAVWELVVTATLTATDPDDLGRRDPPLDGSPRPRPRTDDRRRIAQDLQARARWLSNELALIHCSGDHAEDSECLKRHLLCPFTRLMGGRVTQHEKRCERKL